MTKEIAGELLQNEMREIINNVSDSVLVFDPGARLIWQNDAARKALNIEDEYIGKTAKKAIDDGLVDRAVVYEVISTGKMASGIISVKNGREILVRCCPIYNEKGGLKFLVSTSTSILELNELWGALKKKHRRSDKYLREIELLRKVLPLGEAFIFESPDMKSLMEDIKKVAPMDCNVIITGETGVGKEIVAKILHMNSPRKDAPFIPVCVPAIPENLLEAELFGYEAGAFTGSARGGKIGLFEMAQNGTLFLDEIGDIPFPFQVKILRAIECGEIRRLGGTKTINLNIRIISATNRNFGEMFKRGLFREDLFYRLSVVHLVINPLRERPEDILPLCRHFIDNFNAKYNTNKKLSNQAINLLKSNTWPGNVRELKNTVERLVVLSNGTLIIDDDVRAVLTSITAPRWEKEPAGSDTMKEYNSYERATILEAMKNVKGNKSGAARMLGITRATLYRKLRKL